MTEGQITPKHYTFLELLHIRFDLDLTTYKNRRDITIKNKFWVSKQIENYNTIFVSQIFHITFLQNLFIYYTITSCNMVAPIRSYK